MAEINSFPNNSDEYIGAEEVMRWLHGRTKGVYAGEGNAAVTAVQGEMQVQVAAGIGWMTDADGDGICWWFDSPQILLVDAAESTGTLNRIDRVIIEWETTDYSTLPVLKILKGQNRSVAVAPDLTNTASKRQISLARISIPAGTTALTNALITDERQNPDVCGIVTETVTADTSVISAQYEELLVQLRTAISQAWEGAISDGAISTAKLADGAVTEEKLDSELADTINGKVDKAGDTMTGNLKVSTNNSPSVIVKNTDFDKAASSLSAIEYASYAFQDGNNGTMGYVQVFEETSGTVGIALRAYKTVEGADVANYLNLNVNKNGVRSVAIPDAAPWRTALGLGTSGALPITIAQGGTGGTTAAKAKANLGLGTEAQNFEFTNPTGVTQHTTIKFINKNSNNTSYNGHIMQFILTNTGCSLWDSTASANAWSLGLPVSIANGGTGQAAVTKETTASNILTAASGVTITEAKYAVWGKLATVWIHAKCSSAITNSGTVIGTLKSGKRPAIESIGGLLSPVIASAVAIGEDGTVTVRGVISANAQFWASATYLLA